MLDDAGAFRKELTFDGLHPNDAGYEIMVPLAEKAIATEVAGPLALVNMIGLRLAD
jgi:lysophospholipase L1-like esterase